MTLIVGLGNIGTKYELTRHNIGFLVIDKMVNDQNLTPISKASFKGEVYKSNDFILLKPHTYMNLSGESVIAVKNFYKCEDLIVIHDDLDLSFGVMKFKIGGSSGGHNGLKSVDKCCGNDYKRVRLGLKPFNIDISLATFISSFEFKSTDIFFGGIYIVASFTIHLPSIYFAIFDFNTLCNIPSLYSKTVIFSNFFSTRYISSIKI
jgi:PTH1 family peptidyl-tRNA hydrolase